MGKKILFIAIMTFIGVIAIAAVLEGGARAYLYLDQPGQEWITRMLEPQKSFVHKESKVSHAYQLVADWSFHKRERDKTLPFHSKNLTTDFTISQEVNEKKEPLSVMHQTVKTEDGEFVYDVVYTFDKFHHRITPQPQGPKKRHVIFSGCSYTFGEGLRDNETLPSQFAVQNPEVHAYNFGVQGSSIAETIHSLNSTEAWDSFSPRSGLLLISFSASMHLPRFFGSLQTVGKWNQGGLAADFNTETRRFDIKGTFAEVYPLWVSWAQWVARSRFLSLIKFDWPRESEAMFERYVLAIDQVCRDYKTKYSEGHCIVYILPGRSPNAQLVSFLDKQKIHYLDYSEMPIGKLTIGPSVIAFDGHPNAEWNRIFALQLTNDLRLPENQRRLRAVGQ